MNINEKIVCFPIPVEDMTEPVLMGDENTNGHLIVRSSKNEELLYLDGACGPEPIFMGITKSRGDQNNKLPVEPDDFLGGLQLYARTVPGDSLGYRHEETPLVGAIQFKVSENYVVGEPVLTDLILGLTDSDGMSVKLKVTHSGNLEVAGNISLGKLSITDEEVLEERIDQNSKKFVKVFYMGNEYALPIFSILS